LKVGKSQPIRIDLKLAIFFTVPKIVHMLTKSSRSTFNLWSAPSGTHENSLEENGITQDMIAQISETISAATPSDISERLKLFDTKLEESANSRIIY